MSAAQRATGTLTCGMPTYEYTCRDCGHTFDIVQSMWDEPLTMCPECGGSLRKVFAPPAISFKGSGFYATDHGKKAKASTGEKTDSKASETTDTKKDPSGGKRAHESSSGDAASGSPSKKEPAPS
ncbi:MAG: FmdB family zinc ribbon protein [Gemmatimonadota bacterium]